MLARERSPSASGSASRATRRNAAWTRRLPAPDKVRTNLSQVSSRALPALRIVVSEDSDAGRVSCLWSRPGVSLVLFVAADPVMTLMP
jgi:hypothetical protein